MTPIFWSKIIRDRVRLQRTISAIKVWQDQSLSGEYLSWVRTKPAGIKDIWLVSWSWYAILLARLCDKMLWCNCLGRDRGHASPPRSIWTQHEERQEVFKKQITVYFSFCIQIQKVSMNRTSWANVQCYGDKGIGC